MPRAHADTRARSARRAGTAAPARTCGAISCSRSRAGPDLRRRPPLPASVVPRARARWPAADRVGRPLPRVRSPGRATGLRLGAAPRRRREPDRLPALAGPDAHGRRRARRTRAVRLVSLPSRRHRASPAATCRSCRPHTPTRQALRYRQESFAAPLAGDDALASFVRISADARHSATGARPSDSRRRATRAASRRLTLPRGARHSSHRLRSLAQHGRRQTACGRSTRSTYEAARRAVREYWDRRLAAWCRGRRPGASRDGRDAQPADPEPRPDLALQRRQPVPGARHRRRDRRGRRDRRLRLRRRQPGDPPHAFGKRPTPFPNWKMGAKLAGTGLYYRLFRDRALRRRRPRRCSRAISERSDDRSMPAPPACSRVSASRRTSPSPSSACMRRRSCGKGCG